MCADVCWKPARTLDRAASHSFVYVCRIYFSDSWLPRVCVWQEQLAAVLEWSVRALGHVPCVLDPQTGIFQAPALVQLARQDCFEAAPRLNCPLKLSKNSTVRPLWDSCRTKLQQQAQFIGWQHAQASWLLPAVTEQTKEEDNLC